MIDRKNVHQSHDQIIDIAQWPAHDEYMVFPVGARDKSLRICPSDTPFNFCIPNHKYLFKEAIKSVKDPRKPRHPDQYWSEVIAFKIGRLMGLTIPPAFVAIDSETGEPGTVIEWFTGYDTSVEERFTQGGDHMQDMIEGYDRKKGKQHNLRTIITYSRLLSQKRILSHCWQEYWGLCLCFDALIGNTDRHQENWGIIWNDVNSTARLTPFYDNGTSLGHELFPDKFNLCLKDINMLNAYITRGRHHMKWHLNASQRLPLIDGVTQYCQKYPKVISKLVDSLRWGEDALMQILSELTTFAIQSPLTAERAEFVYQLTCNRRRLLLDNLEKMGNEVH